MPKNIIICCDGTANEYGKHNTNVVGVFQAAVKNEKQIAFYDPGVGTFDILGRTLGKKVGIMLGQAFGWGLQQNIEDAYIYLMDNYEQGDKVFLFGFSRGAYTARSLAGMLLKCGLLQKGSLNLVSYVTKIYNENDNADIAAGFKNTFCQECNVHFVGVWDTVGSLGYLVGKKNFDTELDQSVTYGYHAVSIDEKRKKFPVSLWDESKKAPGQIMEQVWFAGVHSDVGGSYPETGLSDCALMWMLQKAEAAGMNLKKDWEKNIHSNPTDKKSQHESRKGFWKIWPKVERKITENALIHESVFKRIDAKVGYDPKNLPREKRIVQ